MVDRILLLLGYIFVGGGLKYVDQAFDESIFPKKKALAIGLACGAIGGLMILVDTSTSIIFLSILLALVVTRKIDNIAFLGATLVSIILVVLRVLTSSQLVFSAVQAIPAIVLVSGASLDEIGNDLADKSKLQGISRKFFLYRFIAKISMVILVVAGFFDVYYLLAFLLFDLTYTLVEQWSWKVKEGKYRFRILT